MGIQVDDDIRFFLEEHAAGYGAVEPMDGDASTRAYWRVRATGASYVLCRDRGFIGASEEEYPFTVLYRLLRGRVPVPEIIAMDKHRGLFLLQDLGDDCMEYVRPRLDMDGVTRLYTTCIENLFLIQTIRGEGGMPFSRAFDVAQLMFEFDFFIEHALDGYWNAHLAGDGLHELRSEFLKISQLLYRPELFVLNHRDYHSRNIIICGDTPYIIDYQDARMGFPHYDAVSLLRDSYAVLDEKVFEYLLNYNYEGGREMGIHSMKRDEFNYYFDIMAFQRNVKALGTFGYQVTARGNSRYERYIRPTAAYLGGYADRQDELFKAWRILKRFIKMD